MRKCSFGALGSPRKHVQRQLTQVEGRPKTARRVKVRADVTTRNVKSCWRVPDRHALRLCTAGGCLSTRPSRARSRSPADGTPSGLCHSPAQPSFRPGHAACADAIAVACARLSFVPHRCQRRRVRCVHPLASRVTDGSCFGAVRCGGQGGGSGRQIAGAAGGKRIRRLFHSVWCPTMRSRFPCCTTKRINTPFALQVVVGAARGAVDGENAQRAVLIT